MSESWRTSACLISSTLPEPAKVAASGRSRRPPIACTTLEPALSTRRVASSARSSAWEARPRLRATRTAGLRSGFLRVLKRDRDRPRRNHRGDRVLVNHLRHGVLEEHDVLVERFDLSLELDAVHQVDRNRYVFLAQRVEEWVLQQLALVAHCSAPFLSSGYPVYHRARHALYSKSTGKIQHRPGLSSTLAALLH